MSGGREFQRLGADRPKTLDPMVVRLADWVLDGRRGSESEGGCVDMDKFSDV